MPEPKSVTLSRLASLATFVAEHPGVSVRDAATHFGRTPKQLRADVRVIAEAGFDDLLPGRTLEIDLDAFLQGDVLVLRDSLGLERVNAISEEDLALLVCGLGAIAPTLSETELALVPGAMRKAALLAGLGEDQPLPAVEALAAADAPEKLGVIREALDRGQLLHFDYTPASGTMARRVVQPLGLGFAGDDWLLEGLSLDGPSAGQQRSFRLDRMGPVSVREREEAPSLPEATRDIPGAVSATAVLSPDADWLAHELPAAAVRQGPDSIEATFTVWDPAWLRTQLLHVAEHLQTTRPPTVKSQAAAFAREALATWNQISPEDEAA